MAPNSTESTKKKWIEPGLALLMALTTICTAWCSYESAAWTRRSNRFRNESNALIIHAGGIARAAAEVRFLITQNWTPHESMKTTRGQNFIAALGRHLRVFAFTPVPPMRNVKM